VTDDPGPVFAALADSNRRALLELLAAHGEATATELARELPISRQAVAKHLTTLARADLVLQHRRGRESLYAVAPQALDGAAAWITAAEARWDARLRDLQAYLAERG